MNKFTEILKQYHIFPQGVVPITDRLTQIKANGKMYALKRSHLKTNNVNKWLQIYHLAQEKNLSGILPIYLTVDRKLYVEAEGEVYYLLPWVKTTEKEPSKEDFGKYLRTLGTIHLQTKQLTNVKEMDVLEEFKTYQNHCMKLEQKALQYVEKFERKLYPSPLELQVLTHYRDLSYAMKQSQQLTATIIRELDEEVYWGNSLIHGKLEQSHFLDSYFINWEFGSYNHSMHDLLDVFSMEAKRSYRSIDLLLDAFPSYLDENPLQLIELAITTLHLLNVEPYLLELEKYQSTKRQKASMLKQTMQIDELYRTIVFGLKFNDRIYDFQASENKNEQT
ncbi:hypothetical protein [Oceanobacillus sp. CAU 1775]